MSVKNDPGTSALHVDNTLSSAVSHTLGGLPKEAVKDFFAAGHNSSYEDRERIIFECDIQAGRLVLLKPSDEAHPVWREIDTAICAGATVGTGLTLENHLALLTEAGSERPARVTAVSDSEILNALQGMAPAGRLTASELRLLKQLVCGLSLPDAASLDGVSHETKRSQFKSLSRKLGVRSQNELTNKVLTHIFLEPDAASLSTRHPDEYFADLMREFIPSARTFQIPSASGTKHRLVDIGPVSGRPVTMVHSQILPDFRPQDVALLNDYGVRLIIPLRNGAMSNDATLRLDVAAHLDHACEAIDVVRTHFSGEQVDLLLCISGCAYGIEYAHRWPDRVRSLAFAGACVRPVTDTSTAGRLRSGLFSLAAQHWGLYSRVLEFYGRRLRRPDTFRRLMCNMFRPSQADLARVMQEYGSPHGGERARKLFTTSIESMKHDFYHQARPCWNKFPKDAFPGAFFHGSQDFIHPIEGVRSLAKSFGDLPLHVIPDAGQLVYRQHFEPLLRAYSAFLQGRPTAQSP